MSTNAFEFRVTEPEIRKKSGPIETSYWVYKIRIRVNIGAMPKYNRQELEVERRYSDFEWLFKRLGENYPSCIIPPIPEKDLTSNIGKLTGKVTDKHVLEYRQRALRKFLVRVGAHPQLCQSPELQEFLEDDVQAWEMHMKAPSSNDAEKNVALAVSVTDGVKSLIGTNGGDKAGAAYCSALREPATSEQTWRDTQAYVQRLEGSLSILRDRLNMLVSRRRDTGQVLADFSKSFTRVGELEQTLEEQQPGVDGEEVPRNISSTIVAVSQHSDTLGKTYTRQANDENTRVVETVTYYIRLCGSAKDTLQRLLAAIKQRDTLARKVTDLQSAIQRVANAEKQNALEHQLRDVEQSRQSATEYVTNMETHFKGELRRFHTEKQYDIKTVLKTFTDLQVDYASNVRASWEALIPSVENASA